MGSVLKLEWRYWYHRKLESKESIGTNHVILACEEWRLNNAPNLRKILARKNLAWPFSKGSLDLWPQDMWMKMGSMGTHESPLYRHAHFMIITCSFGASHSQVSTLTHWQLLLPVGLQFAMLWFEHIFYAKCSTCEGFWTIFVIVLCC